MNPLEVSGGLKEGRIRLVAECNQCDSITEYDGGGKSDRKFGTLLSARQQAGSRSITTNVNYF